MCKVGGPRCEYSYQKDLYLRKFKRSSKYRNTTGYRQEVLLEEAEKKYNQDHKAEFLSHYRSREVWQTKAKPLSPEICSNLAQRLPKKIKVLSYQEATELTENLNSEYLRQQERWSTEEHNSVRFYSISGYQDINCLNRRGVKQLMKNNPLYGEADISRVQKNQKALNEAIEKGEEADEPRVLYRFQNIPKEFTSQEYIERFYKLGEKITDKGVVSTTEDPAFILAHNSGKEESKPFVVFEILSKKGITLQSDREKVGRVQSWEKERLLPVNSSFRVVGVETKTFSVGKDRENLLKQFGKPFNYSTPIKNKRYTVVQLIDEDII